MGHYTHHIMYSSVLSLVLLSTLAHSSPQPRDLLCDICVDVVTNLDEWLTSDATEGEIVHFMESLCRALGNILPDLETMCIDPMEVCVNIAACYPPPPTTTSLPPTTQARSRRLL